MLSKVNRGLCIFSVVLAIIEIVAVCMNRSLFAFSYVVLAGVGVTSIVWFVAQWKRDDRAVRAATIALAVFVLCLVICCMQLFSSLRTML
ncbi:MAG: hypothetical protein KHY89_06920 [Butyricicoccus pullicaecorum]|nr:hypothetical protein [Butyricicoccus pullicaecorum]